MRIFRSSVSVLLVMMLLTAGTPPTLAFAGLSWTPRSGGWVVSGGALVGEAQSLNGVSDARTDPGASSSTAFSVSEWGTTSWVGLTQADASGNVRALRVRSSAGSLSWQVHDGSALLLDSTTLVKRGTEHAPGRPSSFSLGLDLIEGQLQVTIGADDVPLLRTTIDWTRRTSSTVSRAGLVVRDTSATFTSFSSVVAAPDALSALGGTWSDSTWTPAEGGGAAAPRGSQDADVYEVSDSLASNYAISLNGRLRPGASRQWLGVVASDRAADGPVGFVFRVSFDAAGGIGRWQLHRSSSLLDGTSLVRSGTFSGANAGDAFRLDVSVGDASRITAAVTRTDTGREILRVVLDGVASLIPVGGLAGVYSLDDRSVVTAFSRTNVGADRPFSTRASFSRDEPGTPGPVLQAQRGRWRIEGGHLIPTATDPAGSRRAIAVVARPSQSDTGWRLSAQVFLDRSGPLGESGIVSNSIRTESWNYNHVGLFVSFPSTTSTSASWRLVQVLENAETTLQQGTVPVADTGALTLEITRDRGSGTVRAQVAGSAGAVATAAGAVTPSILQAGKPGLWTRLGGASFDDLLFRADAGSPSPVPSDALEWEPRTAMSMSPLTDRRPTVDETLVVAKTFSRSPVPQALLTTADRQYVAYYDAEGYMTVAERVLDQTFAEGLQRRLPAADPEDIRTADDTHDLIAMARDRDGRIHVSGNMHGRSLVYFMTDPSGDIGTFLQVTTFGSPSDENYVTYPTFLSSAADGPDAPLIYSFRSGASGDGSWVLFEFTGTAWTRLGTLFADRSGEGQAVSAYPDGPVRGPDGRFYVAWTWRTSTDVSRTSRVSYAVSEDLRTWTSASGTRRTGPISFDDRDFAVDDVPERCGLANGLVKLGFDRDAAPVIAYSKLDSCGPEGSNQLFVSRWDGDNWSQRQVSDWRGRWQPSGTASIDFRIAVDSPVVPAGADLLAIGYRYGSIGRVVILDSASLDVLYETERANRLPVLPVLPDATYQWNSVDDSGGGDSGSFMLAWTSYPGNGDRNNGRPTTPRDLLVVRVTKSPLAPR